MTWTPETLEQLRTLRAQGLPCAEIARILGVTRNSVVGKAHRLGLAAPEREPIAPPMRFVRSKPISTKPIPIMERVVILNKRVQSICTKPPETLGYYSEAQRLEAYRGALNALDQAERELLQP